MNSTILRSPDAEHAAISCGRHILDKLGAAVNERGKASVAISGGATPKMMFQWFAENSFDWSGIDLFWVDERAVPPGDPQSNYTMAYETWLSQVSFPADRIHRVHAELPIADAAARYADEIRSYFEISSGVIPVFDVIQQGMGADVHTASLFPGEVLVEDRAGVAAAVYVEKLRSARITILPAVLLSARNSCFLVCGPEKAEAMRTAVNGEEDLLHYPAQLSRKHQGDVVWFVDEAAAALL